MPTDDTLSALMRALGLEGRAERPEGYAERDLRRALEFVGAEEGRNPYQRLAFEIPGEPPVSKRPRKSRGGHVYAQDGGDRLSLGQLAQLEIPRGTVPFEGEAYLTLTVYRGIPAGFPPYKRLLAELGYITPATKPDYDNYAKIITDAMTQRLFRDDGQVVAAAVHKRYSSRPRLEVVFEGRRARCGQAPQPGGWAGPGEG